MTAKRRLPVLGAPASPDAPERPPWQWSIFGAGLIGLGWLTLTLISSPALTALLRAHLGRWSSPEDLATRLDASAPAVLACIALEGVALQVVILAVASFIGGFVVGTWGPGRGVREAAIGGGLVAAAAVAAASMSGGVHGAEASTVATWGSAVLLPVASAAAAIGARRGSRAKRMLVGS